MRSLFVFIFLFTASPLLATPNYYAEVFDENEDGTPDRYRDEIKIKNVTIEVADTDFDELIDVVRVDFKDRMYSIRNHKSISEFVFDALYITRRIEVGEDVALYTEKEDIEYLSYEMFWGHINEGSVSMLSLAALEELEKILQEVGRTDDLLYIKEELNRNYRRLNRLLKQERWEALLAESMVLLGYPSIEELPIKVDILGASSNGPVAAAITMWNAMLIFPKKIDDLTEWLWMVDHELLHAVQHEALFLEVQEELKTNSNFEFTPSIEEPYTVAQLREGMDYHLNPMNFLKRLFYSEPMPRPHMTFLGGSFLVKEKKQRIFSELEAYLHGLKRFSHYTFKEERDYNNVFHMTSYMLEERDTVNHLMPEVIGSNLVHATAITELLEERGSENPFSDQYNIIYEAFMKVIHRLRGLDEEKFQSWFGENLAASKAFCQEYLDLDEE